MNRNNAWTSPHKTTVTCGSVWEAFHIPELAQFYSCPFSLLPSGLNLSIQILKETLNLPKISLSHHQHLSFWFIFLFSFSFYCRSKATAGLILYQFSILKYITKPVLFPKPNKQTAKMQFTTVTASLILLFCSSLAAGAPFSTPGAASIAVRINPASNNGGTAGAGAAAAAAGGVCLLPFFFCYD